MEQRYLLKNFQHKFNFFVPNFYRLVSVEMENFRAGYGKKADDDQRYIWGNYNLHINYQRYGRNEIISGRKVFCRGFSYILHNLPGSSVACSDKSLENTNSSLICEAEYSHEAVPVSNSLFSLLGRIKYIPLKITVRVDGRIIAVPRAGCEESENNEDAGVSVKNRKISNDADRNKKNEAQNCAVTGKVEGGAIGAEDFFKMLFQDQEDVAKEDADLSIKDAFHAGKKKKGTDKTGLQSPTGPQSPDLMAMEKQKRARSSIPLPDPGYYKKYKFFYDQLLRDRAGENVSGKEPGAKKR